MLPMLRIKPKQLSSVTSPPVGSPSLSLLATWPSGGFYAMPPFSRVFYSLYQEVLSMHLQNRLRVTYLSSLLPPPWSKAPSSLPWIAVMLPKGALHLHRRPSPYALSISQSDPGEHIRSSLSFAQNHPGPPVSHMKASLALYNKQICLVVSQGTDAQVAWIPR